MATPARKRRPALPAKRDAGERARVLALYDAAVAALERATKVDEVKKVRDTAEQIKLYARQAQDTAIMAKGADLRLRATRELGKLLVKAKDAGELARRGGQLKKMNVAGGDIHSKPLTLTVVGLTRDVSAEAQKLAKLDARTFDKLREETREQYAAKGARLVSPQSDVLVRQRKVERQAEVVRLSENPMLLPEGPFCGGVADCPWIDDDNQIGYNKRHYLYKYPLMNVDAICALPVGKIFGPHAILPLWITRYHLAIGSHLKVAEAWGFRPRTVYTWNKEIRGLGRGFAVDLTEHIVLLIRGDIPAPNDDERPLSMFSIRKSRVHSQKPDWAHRLVEARLPGGAYVDLFPGAQRKGWCSWGYQAKDDAKRHEPKEGNHGAQVDKPAAQAARAAK
jgi:N6-adenosine-specific RNA methylase IME4